MTVDRLVRDLCDELGALDLPIPAAVVDPVVLDEVDRAIAPARLPVSVRRLWELIDPAGFAVRSYPDLSDPAFGLSVWRDRHAGGFDESCPRHFFQLGYQSHDTLWVECDGPDWEGGCLFESFISDPDAPFTLVYRNVEDWLEVLIEALREGAAERRDEYVWLDNERQRSLAAAKLASYPAHRVLGTRTQVATDVHEWPEAWRIRSGLGPDRPVPVDVDTIAGLLAQSRTRTVLARVRARVLRSHGHLLVYDHSGQMQVAPSRSLRVGPRVRGEYVLDLRVPVRGEPTPQLRDPGFYLNPYLANKQAWWRTSADALIRKAQLTGARELTRETMPTVTTGLVFHRLADCFANPRLNNDPWPEVGRVTDLLHAVPGALQRFIPPRRVINDLLGRGLVEPDTLPGCVWTPFALTEDEYTQLVEELEFEGTEITPMKWGDYECCEVPATVRTYPDYLHWRSQLADPPQLNEAELEAQLMHARTALRQAGDEPDLVATCRLALWDAQRAIVLHLRELWRGDYRSMAEGRRAVLGSQLFEPAVDAFIAQRALWFSVRASDRKRIARAHEALADAQLRLDRFLEQYGPGGTSPPGFNQPGVAKVTREPYTDISLFGFPEDLWTGTPHLGVRRYQSPWDPPDKGLIPGDLCAATLEYGEDPTNLLIVETSREPHYPELGVPIDRISNAMALIITPRTPAYQREKLTGRPDDLLLPIHVWQHEVQHTTQTWIVDGTSHQVQEFCSAPRTLFGLLIPLPAGAIIIAGTAFPERREIVTVTNLAPYSPDS